MRFRENFQLAALIGLLCLHSKGKDPDRRGYEHVADYIDKVGYAGIQPGGFDRAIPSKYWDQPHQFAEYLNKNGNAAKLGLRNTHGDNPYSKGNIAPLGSIIVVRAGTPGIGNPAAGEIAVKGYDGNFWNGGKASFGGSQNFKVGNNYVMGIYMPLTGFKCSGSIPYPHG